MEVKHLYVLVLVWKHLVNGEKQEENVPNGRDSNAMEEIKQ